MERRDFLKISAAGGAAAALEGCGNPDHQLIRFIPEEDLIPGIATWKPSICTLCPAGCGLLVRVMQGEAEVVRNGQLGILKMGLAKKLEGNPAHPINQGKLCPRGQAGLQVTYHPDRIKNPLVRSGPRGSGQFKETSWDEALKQLVSRLSDLRASQQEGGLALITSPLRGQRRSIVDSFAASFKGSMAVDSAFFADDVLRAANASSFGQAALPTLDLSQSKYVISFGTDFLGTWNSPVAQSIGYGQMRQGRPGERGKFVHFEPRISQTAASADEWIPVQPGSDGALALGIAHIIMAEKWRRSSVGDHAATLIDGWAQGLPEHAPDRIAAQTGVKTETIFRIAREAAGNSPAVALIGDAATAHTNGYFNALAVNALNALLGSVGKPGGLQFKPVWGGAANRSSARSAKVPPISIEALASRILSGAAAVKVLVLYNANPVFAAPAAARAREALDKIPFVVSFGSFIDDTSANADLILPDHSPLESWLDDVPPSGSTRSVVSLAQPAMNPLHNTRAMPDVLLDVAHQIGGDLAKALPWKTYDEALQAAFTTLYKEKGTKTAKDADGFWQKVREQGGWWGAEEEQTSLSGGRAPSEARDSVPKFDGAPDEFPFHFLPFASQMFYDGSLAHLPWMQEAPDPLSTVMWGTWVEINTRTAEKLGVKTGDTVEVESAHGKLQAPAFVTPGIAPDVIAMPVGQGHTNFTRYASGRGANPISILAPMTVSGTDSLAWAATRVKIARVGQGKLALFGGSLAEASPELKHR
ncbi:MAG TPA: molybdopterin-dependent oxidoreductase [Candidatus Acidoferrales bacterium]|nr:molybdopterin-dependent oxidoreductase [Candidatus Acidoferrales bacterium]